MPAMIAIDETITAIDHDLYGMPGVGVCYLVRGDADRYALIDTGTSLTVPTTLAALSELGVAPQAICAILCTHIHMDHAGGAQPLAQAFPNADVYIHSATADLLVEPSRLLASTERTIGPALWPLQGTVLPIARERLRPAETLLLDLGRGVRLRAVASPGHAADHIAYFLEESGVLFGGDACGIAAHETALQPVTPPPGFDLTAQLATYERLAALGFQRLLISHCGEVADGMAMLALQRQRLLDTVEVVQQALVSGSLDVSDVALRLFPNVSHPVVRLWCDMTVAGIARYLRKQAEKNDTR